MTAPLVARLANHERALTHWRLAARRLANLETIASRDAWLRLEHYLGVSVRSAIDSAVRELEQQIDGAEARLRQATTDADAQAVHALLTGVKNAYGRTEATLDFFSDAILTRSATLTGSLLRACDHLASRAMAEALVPLGRQVPGALTFFDAGYGAAILKTGARLWDGRIENPIAAIKVTRHNILRPTAVLHEAGHAVAHMLDWNRELADALRDSLRAHPALAPLFESWASEIAADAFAFCHTGYAAVAALHEVVEGSDAAAFQFLPGDPHPIPDIRLGLNVQMCRVFGAGPWDTLAAVWRSTHPIERAPADLRSILTEAARVMPQIADTVCNRSYRAFGNRSLSSLINPQRVSPSALRALERDAGKAAFTSPYWIWNEAIRLLALTGYQAGLGAAELRAGAERQEKLMLNLGVQRLAA